MIRNRFLHRFQRKSQLHAKPAPLLRCRLATETLERRDLLTDLFSFRLEATDLDGSAISSVEVGDSFLLSAYGKDLRPVAFNDPAGIFSAYADIQFDSSIASVAMRETQTISLSGSGIPEGTFILSFDGHDTDPISINATGDDIESALLTLPAFSASEINVTGNAFGPWTVQFSGQYVNSDVPELTVDDSSLLGGPSIVVSQATGTNPANSDDAVGSTTYGEDFVSRQFATFSTNLLDEVGAVGSATSTKSPVGLFEKLLFTFQFTADSPGEIDFQSAFASGIGNEVNLYGNGASVLENEIVFGSTTLTVVGTDIPGLIDSTLVTTPTATDSLGQVTNLPVDEAWIHEWQDHWVEIWAQLPSTSSANLAGVETALEYNSDFFTATEVEAGPAFSGNLASNIDDSLGMVSLEAAVTAAQSIGIGQPVLVARVHFESLASDPGVPIDLSEAAPISAVSDVWNRLVDDGSAIIELDNASNAILTVESPPSTDLYPVLYDLDDSGSIDFGDLSSFSSVFLQDVDAQAPAAAYKADFDLSGYIDFGDFSLLSANFLRGRAANDIILMPIGFPDGFAPGAASASAAPSASAMLMAETEIANETSEPTSYYFATNIDGKESNTLEQFYVFPVDQVQQSTNLIPSSSDNADPQGRDNPFAKLGDGASQAEISGQEASTAPSPIDQFYADLGS